MTQLKTAIVTGASRGIGREIALQLGKDGYQVAVCYAGNKASAEEVVAAIEAAGSSALAVQGDLAQEDGVKHIFSETINRFGGVDAVVNSAGIMEMSAIAKGDLAAFDRMMNTNLRGAFLVLSQAAQHVRDGGRIVALTTSAIALALPNYGPYVASKAAVEALVRVMANELRGRNISVNAVAPGPVATELFFQGKSQEMIDRMAKMPPLERLGTPQDIAPVVSFLLSPQGGWVNGQVLRANGGIA